MKKLSTAVLAAALLVSASACAAPTPQLTTEQTCDRVKIVASDSSANMGTAGMTILANRIRPIVGGASDDLKSSVQAFLDYADESAKETPNAEKMTALQKDYQEAATTFGELCQ
jgi:ribulose kinase